MLKPKDLAQVKWEDFRCCEVFSGVYQRMLWNVYA